MSRLFLIPLHVEEPQLKSILKEKFYYLQDHNADQNLLVCHEAPNERELTLLRLLQDPDPYGSK